MVWSNKDVYHGSFMFGRMEGEGTFRGKSGEVYTGMWKEGKVRQNKKRNRPLWSLIVSRISSNRDMVTEISSPPMVTSTLANIAKACAPEPA